MSIQSFLTSMTLEQDSLKAIVGPGQSIILGPCLYFFLKGKTQQLDTRTKLIGSCEQPQSPHRSPPTPSHHFHDSLPSSRHCCVFTRKSYQNTSNYKSSRRKKFTIGLCCCTYYILTIYFSHLLIVLLTSNSTIWNYLAIYMLVTSGIITGNFLSYQ